MAELDKLLGPLYLKEKEIRKLIELLYFSYRFSVIKNDKNLKKMGFSSSHYRIIYFVGNYKEMTIQNLIKVLKTTKQSISRLVNELVAKKYLILSIGFDKRTKLLKLTKKGNDLEKKISNNQSLLLKNILINFDEDEINTFKKIVYSIINSDGKKIFNDLNK
tara:strand:- start:1894 stop:2379 length:486 start_codon:yes stop_codon:yes gene_type:complete